MNDGGPRDQLILGDCALVLKTLPDNSVDAIVTDPPYALTNRTPDVLRCESCRRAPGGNDGDPAACPRCGGSLTRQRSEQKRGFMGKEWDTGKVAFSPDFWREALRVLRPGGHLVAFGGTRTVHRLACAIEDAGAEIRDTMFLLWAHGQGFPKSRDISKSIDAEAGAEREVVATIRKTPSAARVHPGWERPWAFDEDGNPRTTMDITAPATDEARQWQGWGSALKPSVEPILLARKPLAESTIAGNVLAWGTGGLNIDACRVSVTDGAVLGRQNKIGQNGWKNSSGGPSRATSDPVAAAGRWPANLLLSHHESCVRVGTSTMRANGSVSGNEPSAPTLHAYGEAERKPFVAHGNGDGTENVERWVCAEGCPVRLLDEQAGDRRSAGKYTKGARPQGDKSGPASIPIDGPTSSSYADAGSASRFFTTLHPADDPLLADDFVPWKYVPKPSRRERDLGCEDLVQEYDHSGPRGHHLNGDGTPRAASLPRGNHHATVKSVELMRWLARLICRPGGTILDPFMGSGSTGVAAAIEGFSFIGIEQEADYYAISERRIAYARAHPDAFTGKTKPAKVAPAQQPAPSPLPTARRRKGPRMEMVSLFGTEEGVG